MSYTVDLIKKTVKYHGIGQALHAAALIVVNRIVPVKILKCAVLTDFSDLPWQENSNLNLKFLSNNEITHRFGHGYNDLTSEFTTSSLAKGDRCLCVTDKTGAIAAYCWFSNKDTFSDLPQLNFSFDKSFMYSFKNYTHEAFRGQRLHAQQMKVALNQFRAEGYKGIVCFIYSDNFDSLKSHYRMGYKDIGSIITVEIFGKLRYFRTGRCKDYNFNLLAEA